MEEVQEVDLITLINTKVGYSFFLSEREALNSLGDTSRKLCQSKMNIKQGEELSLNNHTYMSRKGDLLYINTCKTRTAEDIPAEGGFIDITLRTFKKSSPPRSCKTDLIVQKNEALINIKK